MAEPSDRDVAALLAVVDDVLAAEDERVDTEQWKKLLDDLHDELREPLRRAVTRAQEISAMCAPKGTAVGAETQERLLWLADSLEDLLAVLSGTEVPRDGA